MTNFVFSAPNGQNDAITSSTSSISAGATAGMLAAGFAASVVAVTVLVRASKAGQNTWHTQLLEPVDEESVDETPSSAVRPVTSSASV